VQGEPSAACSDAGWGFDDPLAHGRGLGLGELSLGENADCAGDVERDRGSDQPRGVGCERLAWQVRQG
jgi:hypothetical protein